MNEYTRTEKKYNTFFDNNFSTVYRIGIKKPFIYEEFGVWSYENGLSDLRTLHILSRRRRNLHGHVLKATTVFMENGGENYTDLDDYQLFDYKFNANRCVYKF